MLFTFLLNLNSVWGSPLILPEKTAPPTPIRHSHRPHPKVGIGEFPVRFSRLHLPSSIYSGDRKARKLLKVSLPSILSRAPSLGDRLVTIVPKPPLREAFESPDSLGPHQSRRHFRGSSMEEGDSSQAAGRERRATASTPSGSGWVKPCPNLEADVDTNATPQTLATAILKAIYAAKAQVDDFIDNFVSILKPFRH